MTYLLDTHAWLWLVSDVELDQTTLQRCRDAANEAALYLSAISLWEISLKASRGKLDIAVPVRSWLRLAVERSRVRMAGFDLEVACECADLPPSFHGDPADRILAATCRVQDLTLLTRDHQLLSLAAQGVFKAERV